jgi:hypothetical protein
MTALDALALCDAPRRYAQSVRPGWPDADERAADLSHHARVAWGLVPFAPRLPLISSLRSPRR